MIKRSSFRSPGRSGAVAAGAFVLVALVGCSSGTPQNVTAGPTAQAVSNQAVPTVQALATQAAPTVQALATQVAPTAQAASTRAAPTVQALATQVAPAEATASAAAAPVRVSNVNVSAQDSTLTLQDVGSAPVDLGNWTLQVGQAQLSLPSGVTLQPGATVRLHTASGTNSQSDVYLGQSAQAIAGQLRPGAQVTLNSPSGGPVTSFVVPNS